MKIFKNNSYANDVKHKINILSTNIVSFVKQDTPANNTNNEHNYEFYSFSQDGQIEDLITKNDESAILSNNRKITSNISKFIDTDDNSDNTPKVTIAITKTYQFSG